MVTLSGPTIEALSEQVSLAPVPRNARSFYESGRSACVQSLLLE